MKIFKEKGYTAIELMAVIMIVGILVALAVPSFSNVTKKNNITATTNELVGLLQYAKTMAVAQNNPVIVCPYTKSVTGDDENKKTEYTCANNFADSNNIGVFLYASKNKGGDFLRNMSIANPIVITNLSAENGKTISFYPDSSSAIHGIPEKFNRYEADGAYDSKKQLTLDKSDFPIGKAAVIKWQISTKTSTANDQCNVIKISAIGQSKIVQEDCE